MLGCEGCVQRRSFPSSCMCEQMLIDSFLQGMNLVLVLVLH